ncbi:RNA polymerase sigma factor [Segatella paludivivens]
MGTSPQEELENKEWRLAMYEAVRHLNETERKVFEMRQLQGISLDEISSSVHIAKSSAKSMISAARKKIFEELKQKMKS